MKTFIALTLITLSLQAFATIRTENCGNYAPTKSSLVISIDDEDESRVLSTGYEIMGNFFPMKVRGCSSLKIDRGQVICGGRIIGAHSVIRGEYDDDMLSNGLRANLELRESAYIVTGSCNPRDKKPLTISFL